MPLSSYNSQRSIGIIGTSGNYYPLPYNVYEIRSQKLPPYTIAKIPSVSETQRHSSQQIEVAPSIISRLISFICPFLFSYFKKKAN